MSSKVPVKVLRSFTRYENGNLLGYEEGKTYALPAPIAQTYAKIKYLKLVK